MPGLIRLEYENITSATMKPFVLFNLRKDKNNLSSIYYGYYTTIALYTIISVTVNIMNLS